MRGTKFSPWRPLRQKGANSQPDGDPPAPFSSSGSQALTGPDRRHSLPVPVYAKLVDCLSSLPVRAKLLLVMVALSSALIASSLFATFDCLTAAPTSSISSVSTSNFATVAGPVVHLNFPDPTIIHVGGVTYAFATTNRAFHTSMIHVQMATSKDNVTWTYLEGTDALPYTGSWATGNRTWSPDVVQLVRACLACWVSPLLHRSLTKHSQDDGTFLMYYADQPTTHARRHCLGTATSTTIEGPYNPQDEPWACPLEQGGAIDPDGFQDIDGRRYVVYKVDGNSMGHGGMCMNTVHPIVPTPIFLQEVAGDGITPIGHPITLLDRDALDGPLIEGPTIHRSREGVYFLFYSSGCFTTPTYDVAYATADSLMGPYQRAARPLFVTGDGPNLSAPGGIDIIKDGTMAVFHGLMAPSPGMGKNVPAGIPPRGMYTAHLTFRGHTVVA